MSIPTVIPFQQVLDALLDPDKPFPARLLYRLSDLEAGELNALQTTWPELPAWRRRALMEDVETLGERDTLLSFTALCLLALKDEDPLVRLPAARTLLDYEEADLVHVYLGLLKTDPEAEVRAVAATGLGRFVYLGELENIPATRLHEVEESLLTLAGSTEPAPVRRRALESLGYSSRTEVSALIETAYASQSKEWVASALLAMGRSADERWQPQILAMLDSNFPSLRAEAVRAAGEMELAQARPQLIELIDDPDDDVRQASILALSQVGGEGARALLEELYDEAEDEEEAELIEAALDYLSFTEDLEPFNLIDLQEEDPEQEDPGELKDLEDALFDEIDDEELPD